MQLPELVKTFFNEHIKSAEDGIVVACSTGIDSMVLLHILKQLKAKTVIAHVNHGMRKDSIKEEEFLKLYCKEQSLELEILHLNPKKEKAKNENFQHWAREKRYAFFNRIAEEKNCAFIATAHHATDKAETFFMNALRGSGVTGLTSLKELHGNVIRPLLSTSREEIEHFAETEGLEWFEDSSNATDEYLRNRVRHHIIPQLDLVDKKWRTGLEVTLRNLNDEKALIESLVEGWKNRDVKTIGNEIHISLDALESQASPVSLLRHLLLEIDSTLPFDALANSPFDTTGSYYYGTSHRALKDRDWLIVEPLSNNNNNEFLEIFENSKEIFTPKHISFSTLQKPKVFHLQSLNLDHNSALLDYGALSFPLQLRKWQNGDKFKPLGMKGFKKISDYLIDEKVPRNEKENTWVLTSKSDIVWLIGHRIDERYKVGEETQKMYLARFS